ncbi:aminodeoxychorismate synthase component I, partial [Acinetobacter oleivorans]|nr:aminodeoxychorismate synthase component I [Acinetobacter oleivorans]
MSQLKKKISLHGKSTAEILKNLQGLTGLIYLNDNNNPVIGFLPQQYILIQNKNNIVFQRQNFNEYKNILKSNQLLDFIQLKENKLKEINNTKSIISFNGGYVGFISYDFAAHQFINAQAHIQ